MSKAFLSNNWITTEPKLLHWRATVIEEFLLNGIFYYWVFCDALIQVDLHESVYLTSRIANRFDRPREDIYCCEFTVAKGVSGRSIFMACFVKCLVCTMAMNKIDIL